MADQISDHHAAQSRASSWFWVASSFFGGGGGAAVIAEGSVSPNTDGGGSSRLVEGLGGLGGLHRQADSETSGLKRWPGAKLGLAI